MRSLLHGVLLLCVCVSASAAEPPPDFDRLAHDFAYTLGTHDRRAFAPLAAGSPLDDSFGELSNVFSGIDCINVHGYRMRVALRSPYEAMLVVDVDADAIVPANGKMIPLKTPWTLIAVPTPNGWKLRKVSVTAWYLARAFLESGHLPDECDGLEVDRTPALAYMFGSEAWDPSSRSEAALAYAESIANEFHDLTALAFCDGNHSMYLRNSHDFAGSLRYARKALAEARESGNADAIAAALFFSEVAEFYTDHLPDALAHLREGAAMIDKIENTRIALVCPVFASPELLRMGAYRDAMAIAKEGLELSRQYGWRMGERATLQALGTIHYTLRDFRVARTYFEQEAAIGRGRDDLVTDALISAADCDVQLGDVDEASQYLRRAAVVANLNDDNAARIHESNVWLLLLRGRYDVAEAEARLAVDFARRGNDPSYLAGAMALLSEVQLRSGCAEDALRSAVEAEAIDRRSGAFRSVAAWVVPNAVGQALLRLGRSGEAVTWLHRSIDAVESERSATTVARGVTRFGGDKLKPYIALIRLFVAQRRPAEALQITERMRGAQLVAAVDREEPPAKLTPEERKRQEDLEQRVGEINKSLRAAEAERHEAHARMLRRRLDEARVALNAFDQESAVVHAATRARHAVISDLDVRLPPRFANTAVLQYVVTDDATIVFVLRGTGAGTRITARTLPVGRERLTASIRDFCTRIESRDLAYAAPARLLYAQLLAPVAPLLHGAREIVIVPDGELWRLPFHALIGRDGKALIEHAAVSYATSVTTLLRASGKRDRMAGGPRLLAYGNPIVSDRAAAELRDVERSGILGPLPDADREVKTIASMYGRSVVRLHGEASEAAFKREAPQYDVLHLATHGFFDDQSPMYSALVLAAPPAASKEDGLLETREILQLRLKARLAVLSACNTGRGASDAGAGVIGVSWAFLVAGCPTAVVTQWDASSASSSALMIAFHRRLTAGASNTEALRRAQLAVMRDPRFHHPFYWAPFIVIGAP